MARACDIGIARLQFHGQQFAAMVDHQVQLEAEKPAGGRLAARGQATKDAMSADAQVVAYGQWRGIDEGQASATYLERFKQGRHRRRTARQQGDHAGMPVSVFFHCLSFPSNVNFTSPMED